MTFTIINNEKSFIEIQQEWEELQIETDISFYSTYAYLFNWYKYHNSKLKELQIICVYKNKKIIAIAPLSLTNKKFLFFKGIELNFMGKADFHNFIIDKNEKKQSIIKYIFKIINNDISWDRVMFSHIAHNTDLASFFLKSEQFNSKFEFLGENPILNLKKNSDFLTYKKSFFKKNITYYRNKLKRDLDVNFEVIHGNNNDVLNEIATIHINRNKERRSLFKDETAYGALKQLYKDDEHTVTFVLKTKEGGIISYATCYLFNRVIHNWNTSFSLDYRDYSVGDLIYFEMINYAFDNKEIINYIDFGAGRYPWKFRMTNTFISTYTFTLNNEKSKKHFLLQGYDKLFKIAKIILNK